MPHPPETRLGEALVGLRQQSPCHKCGRYGADEFDFSAPHPPPASKTRSPGLQNRLRRSPAGPRRQFGDARQIVEETVPAMRKLQQQGKARFIASPGYSLKNLMAIAAQVKVDSILTYCRYNLMIDDINSELIPFAKQNASGSSMPLRCTWASSPRRGAPDCIPRRKPVRRTLASASSLSAAPRSGCLRSCLRFCLDNPASQHPGRHVLAQARRRHLKCLALANDPALLEEIRPPSPRRQPHLALRPPRKLRADPGCGLIRFA